jgi:hypothetical protein
MRVGGPWGRVFDTHRALRRQILDLASALRQQIISGADESAKIAAADQVRPRARMRSKAAPLFSHQCTTPTAAVQLVPLVQPLFMLKDQTDKRFMFLVQFLVMGAGEVLPCAQEIALVLSRVLSWRTRACSRSPRWHRTWRP